MSIEKTDATETKVTEVGVVTALVEVTETPKVSKVPELSKVDQLKKEVDAKIKQNAPVDIFANIVDMMYNEKKVALQALVLEGMKKRDAAAEKLKKESAQADQEKFDSDGNLVERFFSKAKAENIKKLKKELADISAALETFLDKGDSAPLEKNLKNQSGNDQNQNQGKDQNKKSE